MAIAIGGNRRAPIASTNSHAATNTDATPGDNTLNDGFPAGFTGSAAVWFSHLEVVT
ncbi:hypothetical protein [Reyranella sp.]|uniref:hypothetical protein n=1 Tax=Reyranella sp. TaxID=1929291 RepID=UPI0025F042C8|nr:hypothetical protein [Reyranella sp.]